MANRIQGITVEIGGDTTGLSKALSGVNKSINDTKSQLRDVERLLKLDPTNTNLLEQRQRLLGQAIGETKTKLETLKQAETQVQQQFKNGEITQKQYEALQREIIETEQSLKQLESQAKKSNETLSKISATSKKIGDGADKVASKMKPVTIGVTAAGAAAVKVASDYEDSLAKVSTIADTSAKSLDQLSQEVLNISNSTGVSAAEINEALYQAISAGADTAQATSLVNTAVKAAKGGFTDAATAVDGLTSTLNAYGLSTSDADRIANQFLITQNKGKTTFGELASSIGKVAPTAKSAGVATNELLSGIAALTANGIATSESVTGLKAALSNIIKPSASASQVASQLGIDFSASGLQAKGFAGFMQELKEKTGGNLDTMGQLFGSTEALNTILTLTSDDGMSLFSETMQEMDNNTSALDDAFNKIRDTSSESLGDLINSVKNLGIEIGQTLTPVLKPIIEKISDLIQWISGLDDGTKTFILTLIGIIAAIGPVAKLISSGTTVITFFTNTLIPGLGSAFSFLAANPIVLVIGAIAAIIAILVTLWNKCEWFRDAVTTVWEWIKGVFQGFSDWLNSMFSTDWSEKFGVFGEVLNGFFANVKSIWDGIKNIFGGIIDFIKSVFTGNWQGAWDGVKRIFKGIFDSLVGIVKTPINGIISLLNGAIDSINWLVDGVNKVTGIVGIPEIPDIPKIPYLAKGGTLSSGGAIVGEAGPELLTMIGGKTRVTPLTNGQKQQGAYLGGGVNVYIDQFINNDTSKDINQLAETIMDKMNQVTLRKAAVFR